MAITLFWLSFVLLVLLSLRGVIRFFKLKTPTEEALLRNLKVGNWMYAVTIFWGRNVVSYVFVASWMLLAVVAKIVGVE